MRARYKNVFHAPTLFKKIAYSPSSAIRKIFAVGDVVAQLVIVPAPQIESGWVEELTPSKRDTGGFGSTVKKETPRAVWDEDVKPCPRCGSPMSVSEDSDDTVLYQCEDCGYWKRIYNDGHTVDGGY